MDIRSLKSNKYLWFLISTGIIAGMIYLTDVSRFIESIRTAKLIYLIPSFIFGMSVLPIWGYVWYRVFQKSGIDLPFRKTFRIFMAGQFMNSITPLGQAGGEPVMAYLLQENSDTSYEKAISSIMSADIMNATPPIVFVLGGSAYLLLFSSLNQVVIQALYMVLLATVVGGGLIYLLWFNSGTIEGKLFQIIEYISDKTGRGSEIVDKLEHKLEEVEESFQAIGEDPIYLLKTSMISHFGFILQVFNFAFIMYALGYSPDFTPIYFVVVLSGLANFSPTPGGSGTYEAAMAGLITVFFTGVPFATGLTVAIIFRLTTFWTGLLLGWISLNTLNGHIDQAK